LLLKVRILVQNIEITTKSYIDFSEPM